MLGIGLAELLILAALILVPIGIGLIIFLVIMINRNQQ